MLKIKISMGSTYIGCPTETVEFDYYGTIKEFNRDHEISTEILNLIFNHEFPHYFLEIDTEEIEEEGDEDYE